ncbi:unnamed protein product [Peniophora sp. CBMAI 1063]|nr:unnamed protein product [Peniophora sp. CBMAI 1063]
MAFTKKVSIKERPLTLEFVCDHDYKSAYLKKVHYLLRTTDGRVIAQAFGEIILRNQLVADRRWEADMEVGELRPAICQLFNSRARLPVEHISNPHLRGTGVWGSELNRGSILTVDYIAVEKEWLPQTVVTPFVKLILSPKMTTMEIDAPDIFPWLLESCTFAIAAPSMCFHSGGPDGVEGTKLLQDAGFRRIGCSNLLAMALRDSSHPSRSLPASEDADEIDTSTMAASLPFCELPSALRDLIRPSWGEDQTRSPLCTLIVDREYSDEDIVIVIADLAANQQQAHFVMPDSVRRNATPLHLAAIQFRVAVIEKLLASGARESLSAITVDGLTPLDCLHREMRATRDLAWKHSVAWPGHSPEALQSQHILLKAMERPIPVGDSARWGCTCGQCTGGWLSPAMLYQIQVQAEHGASVSYKEPIQLTVGFRDLPRPIQFYTLEMLEWFEFIEYIPMPVREAGVNAMFLKGYSAIFAAIASLVKQHAIPTVEAVLEAVLGKDGLKVEELRFFLENGGKVEYVLNATFDLAFLNVRRHNRLKRSITYR